MPPKAVTCGYCTFAQLQCCTLQLARLFGRRTCASEWPDTNLETQICTESSWRKAPGWGSCSREKAGERREPDGLSLGRLVVPSAALPGLNSPSDRPAFGGPCFFGREKNRLSAIRVTNSATASLGRMTVSLGVLSRSGRDVKRSQSDKPRKDFGGSTNSHRLATSTQAFGACSFPSTAMRQPSATRSGKEELIRARDVRVGETAPCLAVIGQCGASDGPGESWEQTGAFQPTIPH